MDVILDPFPFGGGNTILEALATGTPVLTCPSNFARGRLASVFLKEIGLEKLICESPQDYARAVIRLVNDAELRAGTRVEIAEKRSALFENDLAVRQFEDLLSQAHGVGLENCQVKPS